MNSSSSQPRPVRLGAGRIVVVIVAALAALAGLASSAGGAVLVGAHATQRDSHGFYATRTERFSTSTYALTSRVDLGQAPGERDWTIVHPVGTVRIRATGGDAHPLFVAIGPEADVDRWLAGVSHEQVTGADFGPFHTRTTIVSGEATPTRPDEQRFWAASAAGGGTQTVSWPSTGGHWTMVVMNADAQRGVTADVAVGAKTAVLLPIGIGLVAFGLLLLVASALLVFAALRGQAAAGQLAQAPAATVSGAYPARLNGRLDQPLSRWLWLVKWVLVIPHVVVLAMLWLAVMVLTIAAGFAILFTGRYPRSIFGFNVGVMRWTWRVSFYATSAFGTDRYPPFSLASDPDYPADFTVDHPDHLSRGLVLVKWWLLALPHYVIVAVFAGGWSIGWAGRWRTAGGGGLIALLSLIAVVVLAFKGRYPPSIFEFVMGLNRWCFRVLAYVALMTDAYPPFRLDSGGVDPGSVLPPPTPPTPGQPAQLVEAKV